MFNSVSVRTTLPPHPAVPAGPLPTVQVGWRLNAASWLEVTFVVTLPPGATWHSTTDFSTTDYARNWGLWEHDVVEVFVQARPFAKASATPYHELQISPLGQPFALCIDEPRRRYHAPRTLAYTKEICCTAACWRTRLAMQVPGYQPGAPLFGNLTACLGPADQRGHFALAPSTSEVPDFHRPYEFIQLV